MASQTLPAKLLIKTGNKVKLVNAPVGMKSLLSPLPAGASLAGPTAKACDVVLLFTEDSKAVYKHFAKAAAALVESGILWVAYPKGTSKNYQSDLNRDRGWEAMYDAGYVGVSLVSINEDWTAARCRPGTLEEIKKEREWKVSTRKDTVGRTVEVPPDLAAALKKNPTAKNIFDAFAYTHRKEYVRWINEAKQAETRQRRINQTVERIAAGKKYS